MFRQRFSETVKNIITKKDYDWLHVVTGKEGVGKTSLALRYCIDINPDFSVDDVIFSTKELVEWVKHSKKGMPVLIDEGALVFFSRDTMRGANKEAVKLLTGMRTFNLFVAICVPNFWVLDRYIREHRVKTVARVIKRGFFWHYSPHSVKKIVRDRKTLKTVWPRYDFRERYYDAFNMWKFSKEYRKKKGELLLENNGHGTEEKNAKCLKCGYEWNTRARAIKPPCPMCRSIKTCKDYVPH